MGTAHRSWLASVMIVYRIDNQERQDNALTGIGAELYGGRWNRVGERAVYCAMHRSLAILEILSHVRNKALFPVNRVMLSIDVPEQNIYTLKLKDLEDGWEEITSYRNAENSFYKYCLSKDRLAIRVPSVIVPEEYNIVLNPKHKSFKTVKVIQVSPLLIDDRLL